MAEVEITPAALAQFEKVPLQVQKRIRDVFQRLSRWPVVSGAKPLRGELAGSFRIRTGDYRIVFRVRGDLVTVWKIGDRRDVYD